MGGFFTKEKLRNCGLALLLAALVAAAGGCGGGSDGRPQPTLYVAGELHGDLAVELAALLPCVPYSGQAGGGPLIVSYDDGLGMDEQTAEEARRLLDAGYAVGIMHATADEINDFLGDLDIDSEFMMPSANDDGTDAYKYVEFFGIKIIDGDVLTYVTLNDDQQVEELNTTPDTIYPTVDIDDVIDHGAHDYPDNAIISADVISGDACVGVSLDHYLDEHSDPEATEEDIAEMEASKTELEAKGFTIRDNKDGTYTVMKGDTEATSADLHEADRAEITVATQTPEISEEDAKTATERTMAENIVSWMFSTDTQAAEIAAEKESVANALNASNATGGDLKQVMNMYQKTYDASAYNQVFKIFVDAYACRAYNSAPQGASGSGSNSDWFFIKQYAQLNPSGNYVNEKHKGLTAAQVRGYMVYYSFDNWLVDSRGNEVTSDIVLHKPKPDSTVGSTTEGQSSSFSFGGNVGFSGLSGSGGLSIGGSFSYDQSTTVPDCQVDNQSMSNGKATHAAWKYSFSRPQTTGHPCIGCNDFRDAPTSARSMFQPENQWTWELKNDTARNTVKGFKFSFKWQNGYSNGEGFSWWIKVAGVEHKDWNNRETTFYVPFNAIMPPLIAANDLEFNAAGAFQTMKIGTCNSWTASSDSSWCHIEKTSGTPSDGGSSIRVTVDPNTTGADRTAYITLSTTNAAQNESIKVEVFQSRY